MSQSSSDSPPSHSAQRTHHSPPRHAPYSSEHRRNHPHNENRNTTGPGQQGDFAAQYFPYNNGSSGGYERTPFSLQNHDRPGGRLPALTTVVSVDELSTQYSLDNAQRKAAHVFCKLNSEDRAVVSYVRLLHTERQNNEIKKQLERVHTHLEGIGSFCMQTWKPSKQQTKLLKSLIRHYIIRPITNVVGIVETYIHDHAKRLHLDLYKQDPTVKAMVHDLLATENNGVRSALRKLVFNSVKEKVTLTHFSKKVVVAYHLPTIPTIPPKDIMACLALMREVAKPLVNEKNARGGDTGFWVNLEAKLDTLFEKNGNERDSSEWKEWEQEVIDADDSKYNRHAAESNARTQQEIDAALLANPDATAAAAANGQDDEDTNEDRDLHMSSLGDLGALTMGPVSRS